jgi:hypothetical protein
MERADYPTLQECVYLNQASLGLIGNPAVDAMHDLLDRVARHGNLRMSDEDEVAFLNGLRERAARVLMVEGFRVAIVSSASELLGQAPFLLSPRRIEGDLRGDPSQRCHGPGCVCGSVVSAASSSSRIALSPT